MTKSKMKHATVMGHFGTLFTTDMVSRRHRSDMLTDLEIDPYYKITLYCRLHANSGRVDGCKHYLPRPHS